MIFEGVSVIATQITEVIRSYAPELLGRREVSFILETVKKTLPSVVQKIYPHLLNTGQIRKVLQKLVKEKVSIIDSILILETLADYAHITKDIERLLKDSNPLVRCEGIKTLSSLSKKNNLKKIFKYLDGVLEDKDENVRLEAAKVIRELSGRTII